MKGPEKNEPVWQMSDILIIAAFLAFVVFLVAGRRKKYVAMAGWTILVLSLLTEVPEYLSLDNLLYPLIAVLSVPFLAITIRNLLRDEPISLQLSNAAAIATLIYVPFTFIPMLRDLLIGTVVNETIWLLHVLGHHAQLEGWNIIIRNGFATEIILACTGITAIAIMLGVTAGSEKLSLRHGILALLLVVPTIYVLNILRVVAVFIAWSDQWFSFLPDPSGGSSGFGVGYASFFWAHNVFAEILSLLVLVAIAYALFRVVPGLAEFARDLIELYLQEVRAIAGRLRIFPGIPK